MSQLQKEIRETLETITNLERIRIRYDEAVKELKNAQHKLDSLHSVMVKELEDLNEIESKGLKPFFYKVLGSKEEQIEKERQEYLTASLKFNEHQKSVEVLEFELELLQKKLKDSTALKKRLEVLKAQRENEILKAHPTLAKELLDVSKEVDAAYVYRKELLDVEEVGSKCIKSLNDMVKLLKQAKQWGNWDMAGGRSRSGRRAGYNKQASIDKAKNISVWVKHELINLNKELNDIGHHKEHFQLSMDNFNSFTDIFFDNLISDWVVQQKISNTMNNTVSVRDRVVLIVKSIQNEIHKVEQKLISLQSNRDKILIS
jgi:hypothetical protein